MSSRNMVYAAVAAAVILYAAYTVFLFWNAAQKSAPLIRATSPYNREDPKLTKNILVLGDSLAVGVGARGELTVAGRLGERLRANVENYGKSGAQTRDLDEQLSRAKKDHYDVILIQIGANDVIQLKSLTTAQSNMDRILGAAQKKSAHVIFLTSGNIGDAPLWPFPWPYIYTERTLDLRDRFKVLAEKHGALYVDLYARGNLFASDPDRYYANDKLHLTADGYGTWFDVIWEEVTLRWPDIAQ